MAATKITKKPDGKVSGFTRPSRVGSTNSIVSKFKVPANDRKSDNKARATGVDVWWTIKLADKTTLVSKREDLSVNTTSSTLNIGAFTAGGKSYNRRDFYPYTNRKIRSVQVQVREINTHKPGNGEWRGKWQKDPFEVPYPPTITGVSLDSTNGRVYFSIRSGDGPGLHERARTKYRFKVEKSEDKSSKYYGQNTNTALEFSVYYDVADWQSISTTDYITVTVEAWNEGWAGDSKPVTKSLTLSYPAKAIIGDVECAGTGNDDKVTVYATAGTDAERAKHPVTLCRLEALVDSEYQEASDIPGGLQWEPIGATDNGNVKAFASKVGQLRPQQGNKTWLRVITINQVEDPYNVESEYKSIKTLEVKRPTAEDDSVFIVDPIVPSSDGTSADATIIWTEDTPNTGTEITWSQDNDAWESTRPPSAYEFEWSNIDEPPTGSTGAALIHIMDLPEGVVTYVRARRYYEDANGNRTYTQYSNIETVMPVTSPNSVVLSVPPFVPRGSDIEAVWTYDTNSAQTSWQIFQMLGQTPDIEADRVLEGGEDARGSYVIPADSIDSDELSLYVSMSTGGNAIESDPVKVALVDPPECGVEVDTLTAKPMEIGISSNVEASSVTLVVTAMGTTGDGFGPEQLDGDTVWSTYERSPEWQEDSGTYHTTVTVPDDAIFYDAAEYVVTAKVTDGTTELTSPEAQASFSVAWDNPAPPLVDDVLGYLADISITPSDTTDGEGVRSRVCEISLKPPQGAGGTEVYDLYRVGRDEAQLVAEDIPLTATVTDPYAPFGGTDLAYRVVCRTTDGDREWVDIDYIFGPQDATDRIDMRIDFADRYVECERGVAPSDKWTKSFTLVEGIDGSMTGLWGNGIRRESSAQATFVRVYEESQQRAMEELARHAGPCFVRVSDGSAYEANVDVTGRSRSTTSAGVVYSLSMTRIDLTREFLAEVGE